MIALSLEYYTHSGIHIWQYIPNFTSPESCQWWLEYLIALVQANNGKIVNAFCEAVKT